MKQKQLNNIGLMKSFIEKRYIILLCVAFAVSGCASAYGVKKTQVHYYPQCYDPIAQLRAAESKFRQAVVTGAVVGGLLGATAGLLAGKDAKSALIGGAGGAVAGGVTGYVIAKQSQIKDDNMRMASYIKDLDSDISNLTRTTAAAKVANCCYNKQFATMLSDYKAGKISKGELTSRYTEIKSGMEEAAYILGSVSSTSRKKEEDYQAALRSEAAKAGQPVPPPTVTSKKTGGSSTTGKTQGLATISSKTQKLRNKRVMVDVQKQQTEKRLATYQKTIDDLMI